MIINIAQRINADDENLQFQAFFELIDEAAQILLLYVFIENTADTEKIKEFFFEEMLKDKMNIGRDDTRFLELYNFFKKKYPRNNMPSVVLYGLYLVGGGIDSISNTFWVEFFSLYINTYHKEELLRYLLAISLYEQGNFQECFNQFSMLCSLNNNNYVYKVNKIICDAIIHKNDENKIKKFDESLDKIMHNWCEHYQNKVDAVHSEQEDELLNCDNNDFKENNNETSVINKKINDHFNTIKDEDHTDGEERIDLYFEKKKLCTAYYNLALLKICRFNDKTFVDAKDIESKAKEIIDALSQSFEYINTIKTGKRTKHEATPDIQNLMGICYGLLNNFELAIKYFKSANFMTSFNCEHLLRNQVIASFLIDLEKNPSLKRDESELFGLKPEKLKDPEKLKLKPYIYKSPLKEKIDLRYIF